MRRSIGPGMGSGRGGGGGGGGMIKTVQRAMRGGIGGGASPEPPAYSHFTTRSTTNNTHHNHQQAINTALSLSSNNLHHPAPAALPPKWTTSECEESDWECIDDDSESGCHVINTGVSNSNDDYVFGSVPSKDEVHHAVSSLQEVIDEYYGMIDKEKIVSCPPPPPPTSCYFQKSGSDQSSDWSEPPSLDLICNSRTRVYDAFHLMQTDPSVQRMVISLSSDKAVWDAVMKNEVVRELQESISEEEKSIWEDDDVDIGGNPVKQVVRWMFVNTKDKVVEIVTKIVNVLLVQPTNPKRDDDQAGTTTTTTASASTSTSPAAADSSSSSFQEKLKSSFLLSIMVLLIVVVTRATRKA